MKEKIFNLLKSLGIEYRYVEHPAVFTVAESSVHLKDKTPIKNLLLKEDKGDRIVLVIMSGEQKLDTKGLAKNLGIKKLQFSKPDLLKKTLGVKPGAVSLFGLLNKGAGEVEVVVDAKLTKKNEVGFHPNENTSTIFISGAAIEKILKSAGNQYRILSLY